MKPPPFILGAALLFWGWRTDMLWLGILAGVLLEAAHFVRARWDFTDREFNRLWDICTVIFVGAALYLRFSEDVSSAAYTFFEWMPLVFFPMVLGYIYSVRDVVPMKAFSWLLRRKGAQGGDRGVAFGWPYLVVCLVAAGATNATDIWFFVGSAALIGWALWVHRPRRIPAVAWCILFLGICSVAYVGQSKMIEVQSYFEEKVSELIVKLGRRREFNPSYAQTSMGNIGELKQSSRVVMKVKQELGPVPERLLESSYGRLDGTTWRGGGSPSSFDAVAVEPDGTTWNLATNSPVRGAVRIIERVGRKSALLAVPMGTRQFLDLHAGSVETNRMGVVRVRENPGLLDYVARFGPVVAEWHGWSRRNGDEQFAIERIARELNINELPEREKIAAIVRFFNEKFRYTTFQQARELGLHNETPLTDFLLRLRAGHCEYFASATVLLLRHYGIPSRYATGYAVQELSREEDAYIIRERHGHAWAIAEVDGEWIEVDSTPAGWAEAEASEFTGFQDLKDAWSRFTFGFLEWRWLGDWAFFRLAAPWLVLPLALFLIWRIFARRMSREQPALRQSEKWPGEDSEFFLLERRLARRGFIRQNGETTADWLSRVSADLPAVADLLPQVVRIHHRYRFGGVPIETAEREQLRVSVKSCLARL